MDPRLIRLADAQRMRPDATSTAGLFRPERQKAPELPSWLQAAELGADIVTPSPLGAGTALHGLYNMARGYPEEGAEMIGADLAIGLGTAGVGNKVAKARKLKTLVEVMGDGGVTAAQALGEATPAAMKRLGTLTDPEASGRALNYSLSDLRAVPDVPQVPITARPVPAKGLAADVVEAIKSNRRGFEDKVKRGMDEGGLEWYNLDPLRRDYISEIGDEAGNREFLRFTQHLAATSPRSKVAQNIRRSAAFSMLNRQGLEVPEEQALLNLLQPALGHMAHRTAHIPAVRDIEKYGSMAANDAAALKRAKTTSFGENLRGNYEPVTVDAHNARGWGLHEDRIPAAYDALEKAQQELAAKLGIRPAQVQASGWIGGAEETGVADARPFMDVFNDVLVESAKRQKLPPDVLYQRMLRGTGTLGLLGGLGLGAASVGQQKSDTPTTPPL